MTLARRMWLASVTLAFIVVAAFAALIVAISRAARGDGARGPLRDVTAASLRLEKLVVDMETGIRGLTLTGDRRLPPAVHRSASRRCPRNGRPCRRSSSNDPVQRRRAQEVEERIREYVEFVEPLVALVKETP